MGEGLGVGGLCACACPCCAYLLVYTHAYMWEQEADRWARTANDSALHGQDSCFMSMGSHKLHGLAFLLLQHSAFLSLPLLALSSLILILVRFFTRTLTFFSLCPHHCFFLSHTKCHQNLRCLYTLRCRMPVCKCCRKTITLRLRMFTAPPTIGLKNSVAER